MRVVAANNYLYLRGGSERVMFDECDRLRQLGHEVHVFGRCRQADRAAVPHGALMPELVDTSTVAGYRRLTAALNVVHNRDAGRRFGTFLDAVRPDLVHFHNIYAGLTTAIIDACKKRGLPWVITLHDYKLACPSYLMLNRGRPCSRCGRWRYYNCALTRCHKNSLAASLVSTCEAYFTRLWHKYRGAAYMLTPSRFLAEQMLRAGVASGTLRHLPNGVDPALHEVLYADGGYCIYVGRIAREKGLDTLLRAAEGVALPLRILGTGPEVERLREQVRIRSLKGIFFDGYKTGPDLQEAIRGAAFVVVPSECYENASMSVLEAMAHGKPVIASRIGGLPEQVVHGVTGLLFNPGDAEGLRAAMNRLARDPALRQEMGRVARRRVEEEYSLDLHCRRLLALYEAAARG